MVGLGMSTRLSPFPSWMFSASPPHIPAVPSLGELQRRASELSLPIKDSSSGATPRTIDRRPSSSGSTGSTTSTPKTLGTSPPPGYAVEDPLAMLRNEREMDSWQSRSKLKKTKIGWKRLKPQQKIPDEMVRPKMEGSRAYVTPARAGTQPSIGEVGWSDEAKSSGGFWAWLSCRT
ncbi:hypothetical protein JCM24511_07173 [Saitozyma sp. JCM 24511]|nr:hypothetical protein JCM24511_07173 [Saitozyma sp. JCM 24511]